MQTIEFITTTLCNLSQLIKTALQDFKTELKAELRAELAKEFQSKEPTQYLTRAEVCEMLKISSVGLFKYTKKGIFKAYKVEGRVYYKRHEIEQVIDGNGLQRDSGQERRND